MPRNFNVSIAADPTPTPPSALSGGVEHTFTLGANSRTFPDTAQFGRRLGGFEMRANMAGGFMSATGHGDAREPRLSRLCRPGGGCRAGRLGEEGVAGKPAQP